MGWFSKIKKSFKKIWKGIKKVAKKAWKGVKKFVSSGIGKVIIAAAVIYFTAGAGAGMLAGSGAAGGAAGTTVAGGLAGTAAPVITTAAGTGAAVAPTLAAAAAPTAASTVGSGLVSTLGAGAAKVGAAVKGAAGWMAANPMATMVGGQMLSSAFTPSASEEMMKLEEERRKRSNIAGVYGTGEGSPISLGLIQQAQQRDISTPTYTHKPSSQEGEQDA